MFKKIRVSKGKYTIERTERKEPRHTSVLVWVYDDTNLIIWKCSYILLCYKNTHLGRTQLDPWGHNRAGGQRWHERKMADCIHSRFPWPTTADWVRLTPGVPVCERMLRVVSFILPIYKDLLSIDKDLSVICKKARTAAPPRELRGSVDFFWHQIFVLPFLVILY